MTDCSCSTCQSACQYKPGWFTPGEAEKAAEFLGIDLQTFFREHLAVDWWAADSTFESDVFLLSPAVVGEETGAEFPANPRGHCVFYADGQCTIHAVKPFECRQTMHTDSDAVVAERHKSIARQWENSQEQIRDLLGRDPESEEYAADFFSRLFS